MKKYLDAIAHIIIIGLLIAVLITGLRGEKEYVTIQPGINQTYYVATWGDDNDSGSFANPWKNLSKAAATATYGDTIYLRGGTWYERLVPQNSGQAGAWITYKEYPGETATIDGSYSNVPTFYSGQIDISSKNYIIIDGITVANAPQMSICINSSSYVTVQNCYLHHSDGSGVWAGSSSTNITVTGNEIYHACEEWVQEGISLVGINTFTVSYNTVHNFPYVYYDPVNCHLSGSLCPKEGIDAKSGCSNGLIHHNEVYDTRTGIYLDGWSSTDNNIDIYNNYVHDVIEVGIALNGESGGGVTNCDIYNNVIEGVVLNHGFKINTPGTYFQNISFFNNTIANCTDYAMQIMPSASVVSNFTCFNNIFSSVAGSGIYWPNYSATYHHVAYNYFQESPYFGSNYITYASSGLPDFTTQYSDLSLQSVSPCVNAGVSSYNGVSAPSTDYLGVARSSPDIGAYEYVAGGTDVTDPYIDQRVPGPFDSNISRSTNITFHLKDAGVGVNSATIVLTVEGSTVTPSITGTTADYTCTYNPAIDFGYLQVVEVTVNCSDLSGNAMTQSSWYFTCESEPELPTPPTDWLSTYDYRIPISIESDRVSAAVTDFPVTLHLSGTASGITNVPLTALFNNLGAHWQGMAITDSAGTEGYIEIEYWNSANKKGVVHAMVSGAISSTADTTWYLYYDSALTNTKCAWVGSGTAANVWNSSYEAVWHMSGTSTTILDSTSNNHDLTKVAATEPLSSSGTCGYTQKFDGSNDQASIADPGGSWDFAHSGLDAGTSDYTLETLAKIDYGTANPYNSFGGKGGNSESTDGYAFWWDDAQDDIDAYMKAAGESRIYPSSSNGIVMDNNQYHGISASVDRSDSAYFRKDGASIGSYSCSSYVSYSLDNTSAFTLGNNNTYSPFDGYIDEFRISSSARTTAWVDATYYSLVDNLVSFGTAQTYTSSPVAAASALNINGMVTITFINGVAVSVITEWTGKPIE